MQKKEPDQVIFVEFDALQGKSRIGTEPAAETCDEKQANQLTLAAPKRQPAKDQPQDQAAEHVGSKSSPWQLKLYSAKVPVNEGSCYSTQEIGRASFRARVWTKV